jgi:MauM/NapG family ferredoxin protein
MNANKPEAKQGKRPATTAKRREQSRREFIRTSALAAGFVAVSLTGLLPLVSGANARLRPPGALKDRLEEQELLAACIKCGQCVQVCPVEAIKLADLLDGVGVGVPYIDARSQACDFSCDGLQCVLACPTGALTHNINYPAESRMGFARLARQDICLAAQGKGFKGLARGPEYKGKLRYEEIQGSFGVHPEQIADFLALAGDAVDNIKGVPGVGKKTAEKLLQHFGNLDSIFDNLDRVHEVNVRGAKTLGGKLEKHHGDALLARRLTGIACDVPIDDVETGLQPSAPKLGEINALFDEAGIGTALRRQAERVSDIYRH